VVIFVAGGVTVVGARVVVVVPFTRLTSVVASTFGFGFNGFRVVVVVVVAFAGLHPGCGTHRESRPVKQKHMAQVMLGGFQNWPKAHSPATRGGMKWTLRESEKYECNVFKVNYGFKIHKT
jgi:hypothetical protein